MSAPVVTAVTSPATRADDLRAADYRDIYSELRGKTTLRQFAEFIGSAVSFGWWSKYERGEAELTTDRKNELRRMVGLPSLTLPVAATAGLLDPAATVYLIGARPATRAVLVGADVPAVTVRVNGCAQVVEPAAESLVTPVTRPARRATYRAVSLRGETVKRLLCAKNGRTLDRLVNDLLDAWEEATT